MAHFKLNIIINKQSKFDNNKEKETITKDLKRPNLYNSNSEYRLTATLDRNYTRLYLIDLFL